MKSALNRILLIFIVLVLVIAATACKKDESAKEAFEAYRIALEQQDFNAMYSMLSKENKDKLTEEAFVDRNKKIYGGIEAANISIKPEYPDKLSEDKEGKVKIPFSVSMDTMAGSLNLSGYEGILIKEKENNKSEWKIIWSEKMIFPVMEEGDLVRPISKPALRGEIRDRSGNGLAVNGQVVSIEVLPSKFNVKKDASLAVMSEILDIKASDIENKFKNSNDEDKRYTVAYISADDTDKIIRLMSIDGVYANKIPGRVYPGGEAFGSLIGYIGPITAEELGKNKGKGYSSNSKIGKAGLEQVYESRLKGENGGEINIISKKDGKEVKKATIGQKDSKPGENIKLAIDINLQNKIYEEMKKDGGAAAAVNPQTGEILALVSSPSYDSNMYSTYIPESVKAQRANNSKDPYMNRFNKVYAPGSTFKLITGAIGLKNGTLNPEEAVNISGKEWQPDKSWGNYMVTRVTDPGKPVSLRDAYVFSDNIYFAKEALKIGIDKFVNESKNFGLGEQLPIDFPILKSQIGNGDKISSSVALASTGYGQGEVLMSPLHVSLIYGSLTTQGNIMAPILELKGDMTPKIWKEKAIAEDNVKILLQDLTQVVEDPKGTANAAKTNGMPIAGKTGTAELKKNADDKNAAELGWFAAVNTENPRLAIAMMIEDVQGRGDSHYVVPIVKRVMESYLKK